MICKRVLTRKSLAGSVLGAMFAAVIVSGCTVDTGVRDGRDSDRPTVSQDISEREGRESGGEHGGRREGSESSGEHSRGNAVNTALPARGVVQDLRAVESAMKPRCRAQSRRLDSRGMVFLEDSPLRCATTRKPGQSRERCGTR